MGRSLYYSPSIRREVVSVLYHERRRRGIPMTKLVDEILTDALKATDSWRMMEEPTEHKTNSGENE